MTRLARRNRTRCIKLYKRRGYFYRWGTFWRKFTWNVPIVILIASITLDESCSGAPVVLEENT